MEEKLFKKNDNMIKPAFELGQIVFLITDPEQHERIVTGILYRPGSIRYYLAYGEGESFHYEIEIADVKNWKK